MDTFMDKLAQKLNAQEMIKANAAAEAAETARLKEQNAVYEEMLHKLQTSSEQNEASAQKLEAGVVKAEQNAQKVEQGAVKVEQNAAKIEELTAAAIAKIEEMQASAQNTEELTALLEELKKYQEEKFEQLTDHVHKENVKVYRNVQAVVIDEVAKGNEAAIKQQAAFSRKLGAVLGISIVALLVGAANLAFQILVYLHII